VPLMCGHGDAQLQVHRLFAAEKRQVPVGGRAGDEGQVPFISEVAEAAEQISIETFELLEPVAIETFPPRGEVGQIPPSCGFKLRAVLPG